MDTIKLWVSKIRILFLNFKTEGFFWQAHFTDYSGFTYSGLTRNYFKAKILLILEKIFEV